MRLHIKTSSTDAVVVVLLLAFASSGVSASAYFTNSLVSPSTDLSRVWSDSLRNTGSSSRNVSQRRIVSLSHIDVNSTPSRTPSESSLKKNVTQLPSVEADVLTRASRLVKDPKDEIPKYQEKYFPPKAFMPIVEETTTLSDSSDSTTATPSYCPPTTPSLDEMKNDVEELTKIIEDIKLKPTVSPDWKQFKSACALLCDVTWIMNSFEINEHMKELEGLYKAFSTGDGSNWKAITDKHREISTFLREKMLGSGALDGPKKISGESIVEDKLNIKKETREKFLSNIITRRRELLKQSVDDNFSDLSTAVLKDENVSELKNLILEENSYHQGCLHEWGDSYRALIDTLLTVNATPSSDDATETRPRSPTLDTSPLSPLPLSKYSPLSFRALSKSPFAPGDRCGMQKTVPINATRRGLSTRMSSRVILSPVGQKSKDPALL